MEYQRDSSSDAVEGCGDEGEEGKKAGIECAERCARGETGSSPTLALSKVGASSTASSMLLSSAAMGGSAAKEDEVSSEWVEERVERRASAMMTAKQSGVDEQRLGVRMARMDEEERRKDRERSYPA